MSGAHAAPRHMSHSLKSRGVHTCAGVQLASRWAAGVAGVGAWGGTARAACGRPAAGAAGCATCFRPVLPCCCPWHSCCCCCCWGALSNALAADGLLLCALRFCAGFAPEADLLALATYPVA